MKIGFNPIKFTPVQNASIANNSRVNFKGGVDTVSFSDDAKEKAQIIKELIDSGYTPERASEMVKKFYKSDMRMLDTAGYRYMTYDSLVNGDKYDNKYDDEDDDYYAHNIGTLNRNLTPAEAIVYMAEDMNEYFYEATDLGMLDDYSDEVIEKFTPLEFAKYLNRGLNLITAGMVIKGDMDLDTAKYVSRYFTPEVDVYNPGDLDLYDREDICYCIAGSKEEIDLYSSQERNPDGTLKSGLLRPLTNNEICDLMCVKNGLPWLPDVDMLNNYLFLNQKEGRHMVSLSEEEWESDIAEIPKKLIQQLQYIANPTFDSLSGMLHYCSGKFAEDEFDKELIEDLKGLDNDKFFERTSLDIINNALKFKDSDAKKRQQNIAALNGASEELLNKMATGKSNEKGKIYTLGHLLKIEDLPEKIVAMDELRMSDSERFDNMTREEVLDYLTNTNYYTIIGQKDVMEYMSEANPSYAYFDSEEY